MRSPASNKKTVFISLTACTRAGVCMCSTAVVTAAVTPATNHKRKGKSKKEEKLNERTSLIISMIFSAFGCGNNLLVVAAFTGFCGKRTYRSGIALAPKIIMCQRKKSQKLKWILLWVPQSIATCSPYYSVYCLLIEFGAEQWPGSENLRAFVPKDVYCNSGETSMKYTRLDQICSFKFVRYD